MRFRLSAVGLSATLLLLFFAAPASATKDRDWGEQWGPQQIHATDAWAVSRGSGVVVAIVDTGADLTHPDLQSKLVTGYDFGDGDSNPQDDSQATFQDPAGHTLAVRGHGTHVAGIIGAATDNVEGIAGVAPDAKLMPLKVAGSKSLEFSTTVPQAINYAVSHGAKVINLSLGAFSFSSLVGVLETPCTAAFNQGVLCVIASGNAGADKPSGYAHELAALVVTANDSSGRHASFGQKADTKYALSAPGVSIYSTVPVDMGDRDHPGYARYDGTSMAAPHAAAVAALVYAKLKPAESAAGAQSVVDQMMKTAFPMADAGTNGAGRVDAANSVGASITATTTTFPAGVARTTPTATSRPTRTTQAPVTAKPKAGGQSAATTAAPTATISAPETASTSAPPVLNLAGGKPATKKAKPNGTKATLFIVAAALLIGVGYRASTEAVALRRAKELATRRPY